FSRTVFSAGAYRAGKKLFYSFFASGSTGTFCHPVAFPFSARLIAPARSYSITLPPAGQLLYFTILLFA
ncbi:MAG TPA: hypothetical protein DEF36_14475, partial [Desulfotomaculum sp.]|nr:hypothetical protein [Desulfotomaculum sp.]